MTEPESFNVFLCHNSADKPAMRRLKDLLTKRGLRVWFDEDQLRPGMPWQEQLENGIRKSQSVAVCIGADGLGPWENEEMQGALRLAVQDKRAVIPVILPSAPEKAPTLPMFLTNRTWVNLRPEITEDNLSRLIWGITGKKADTEEGIGNPFQGGLTGDPWLDEKVVEPLERRGVPLLEAYERLFTYFATDHEKPIKFDALLESLEAKPQEKRTLAYVSGYPGTGKSTFLLCLRRAQEERCADGKSRLCPIFVSLRDFIETPNATGVSDETIGQRVTARLDSLIAKTRVADDWGLMLIVDGCDEYYRHNRQEFVDRALQEQVERLARQGKVVKVVGVGQSEHSFPGSISSNTLHWAEKDPFVELKRVSVDAVDGRALLETYAEVNGYPDGSDMVDELQQLTRALGIPEVDLFIISLLETAIRRRWHAERSGIGALYFNYCMERIQSVSQVPEASRKLMKLLAEATFHIYLPEVKDLDLVVKEMGSKHAEFSDCIAPLVSGVPHLHASVKEFLIAEHAIELILSRDMPLGPAEGAIYPYGTNRFVKAIINRSEAAQSDILEKIRAIIDSAHTRQRIHLSYILGRFSDRHSKLEAKRILQNLLKIVEGESHSYSQLEAAQNSTDSRNWLLLKRTIYISLIYLGDDEAATSYLREMIDYPVCDNLNRGFHLQYYQDLQRPAISQDMIEPDDLKVHPGKTFDVLLGKLQRDLSRHQPRAMSPIELYTLCSLCVNRHMVGSLSSRHRESLSEFLGQIKTGSDLGFPKEQWAYIEMAKDVLERPQVSVGQMFSELHALKKQRRTGWNATRRRGTKDYIRACPSPESVGDHIWGCMLLASAFLPETIPGQPEFSKTKVMEILLIHDLSEAFLGDKPAYEKTPDDRTNEDRCMARIASLATVDGFAGVRSWRGLWAEWRGGGINAKIAADIDTIESYLQMREYVSNPQCAIPDAELWAEEVVEKLSEFGERIFHRLRHEEAGLLSWCATGGE